MKNTLKLVFFVLIMGSITAGLINGMDLLTAQRIEDNANFEWKSAILDHHDISFTLTNHATIFEETFDPFDDAENENDRDAVYIHNSLNTYSYYFFGGGIWGEINGIVTLEDDGITVRKITVLNNDETPGLGAIVATREYLNNYVGKQFNPRLSLVLVDGLDEDSVVDQITGATGTSNRFINILNEVYQEKMANVLGVDFGDIALKFFKTKILDHHEISYDDSNYNNLFNDNFVKVLNSSNELDDVYRHKDLNTYSYYFEGLGFKMEENSIPSKIDGVITLEDNMKTIKILSILNQSENRGRIIQGRDYLDRYLGKMFDPLLIDVDEGTASDNNEIDGIARATTTSRNLIDMLNTFYQEKMGGLLQWNGLEWDIPNGIKL